MTRGSLALVLIGLGFVGVLAMNGRLIFWEAAFLLLIVALFAGLQIVRYFEMKDLAEMLDRAANKDG